MSTAIALAGPVVGLLIALVYWWAINAIARGLH
jgi:hypothetical protein